MKFSMTIKWIADLDEWQVGIYNEDTYHSAFIWTHEFHRIKDLIMVLNPVRIKVRSN